MPQQSSKGRAKHPGVEFFKATKASHKQHLLHDLRANKKRLRGYKLRHILMVGSQTAATEHKINKRKKI